LQLKPADLKPLLINLEALTVNAEGDKGQAGRKAGQPERLSEEGPQGQTTVRPL